MPVKLAYKLKHRVLSPGPIERQNVQLSQAVFHESTLNALIFYGNRGHPHFLETAQFISIILSWWKLVNVKTDLFSTKKRDPMREAINIENIVTKTSFLRGFVDWLSEWSENCPEKKFCFSRETTECAKITSASLATLAEHLLHEKGFKIFLTGKCQSDKIEGKFGKYRQMHGGNLYASVRQFLEAERTIRIKNLAKLNLDISSIRDIFTESNKENIEVIEKRANQIFLSIQTDEKIDLCPSIPEADLNILFYIAGHFARSICQRTNCGSCRSILLGKQSEIQPG